MTSQFKQFSFKKIGLSTITAGMLDQLTQQNLREFIKVIFLRKGSRIQIDFKQYELAQDAIFFITEGQYYQLGETGTDGLLLYYNRDFYCVALHDKEVSCDGILFHNVYDIPVVYLDEERSAQIQSYLKEIASEFNAEDTTAEEMLRILLKQIIIRSTRIWKEANQAPAPESGDSKQEMEFARKFSQLVEWNYTTKHGVAEYAELLNLTPKALHKRIARYSTQTPNDIIKNRILLEAKRLLVHTSLTVKEIGYKLGYDDPAYFVRFFTNQASVSPQHFRKDYQLTGEVS
ncbi:helix-turn-helix domain-containing protein [Deminuibacter soli]|uniref:Helix-turn-helix domain-containing protein n=1 Tax=Deminuibacter soli TaxID=2291815 RepID=A0A3E1NHD5_9BACT|nr:helix-turn-helix domain-containing protein [Deminuibacter soli]RFM27360.1 helix-turn-helix domain-containing protein [Deminuibacter soli]